MFRKADWFVWLGLLLLVAVCIGSAYSMPRGKF